jgi:vancomycin aglycone glucosyltransferase
VDDAVLRREADAEVPHLEQRRAGGQDSRFAPLGDDAPDRIATTDALVMEDRSTLDGRIEGFLELGPPPVYIGFGSMVARRFESLVTDAVAAARAVGRGVILGGGWALSGGSVAAADDVLMVNDVPHSRVFPRVAAVVHHGGAGTTTAAASAGVPQVIVPHVLDQFYWAHRVAQLGLGPRALPVDLVTADVLTDRIDHALADPVRDRAAAFAPVIGSRNGVEDAVDHIERIAAVQ